MITIQDPRALSHHKDLCFQLYGWDVDAWSNPSLIWVATSRTAPGPWGMKTAEDLEAAPISFIVSKYWVTKTMSITSFAVVPGTLTEKPSTLSLSPSTMAWRWRAIPKPDRYLDSASPSARLICRIFSASAFSVAANLSLAAEWNDPIMKIAIQEIHNNIKGCNLQKQRSFILYSYIMIYHNTPDSMQCKHPFSWSHNSLSEITLPTHQPSVPGQLLTCD